MLLILSDSMLSSSFGYINKIIILIKLQFFLAYWLYVNGVNIDRWFFSWFEFKHVLIVLLVVNIKFLKIVILLSCYRILE